MRKALIGALVALAVSGAATREAAADSVVSQLQERTAQAVFIDLDGDVRTTVSVHAVERRTAQPGGATLVSRPAVATITQRDVTAPLGELLLDVTSEARLPAGALDLDGWLDRGRLTHTFEGFDGVSGRPVRIDVDVSFAAFGDVEHTAGPWIIHSPESLVNGHVNFALRWANAVGAVGIAGRNYADGPAYSGALVRLVSGDTAVPR